MSNMFNGCDKLKRIFVGKDWTTNAVTSSKLMFSNCESLIGGEGTAFDPEHTDAAYARIDGGKFKAGYLSCKGLPYAFLNDVTLTFLMDENRYDLAGTTYGLKDDDSFPGWWSDKETVVAVMFDPSFANARPTSTYYWFANMENLRVITGMAEYLNTSEVTNMRGMFNYCKNLESIDVSSFNTSKVTDMAQMFKDCDKETTLDLGSFDTGNVTDMGAMFLNCDTLTTIYVGEGWNTDKVTESTNMFLFSSNLVGGMGTRYYHENQDVTYAHIDGGPDNPGYLTDVNPIAYAVFNDGTLTFCYDREGGSREGTFYELNSEGKPGWVKDETCYDVTTVVFDPSFANYTPRTTEYWFNNMESLTEILGMKEYLNTQYVKHMNDMFNGCRSMEVLDLSAFKTYNLNNSGSMFANCTSLTTILVGNEWNVSSVIYSTGMFTNCRKLVGMAGTTYDKNHTDKAYAHPDGGEANPGYLTMKMMYVAVEGETMKFYYDGDFYKRTEPVYDVDNLLSALRDDHAFDDVVIAEFDPSFADARPTYTGGWFDSMPKLSTFKGMKEYLNTSEVRSMRGMFNYLLYVEELDLSGFDTHNVQDMSAMFGNNFYLETIWVGDGWNTDNVTESTGMFVSCRRLVGGAGTTYDEEHTDVSYAHVDGGTENPGYLTMKPKWLRGDVNLDGVIDVADIASVISVMASSTDPQSSGGTPADVNSDGSVDVADIASIISIMAANSRCQVIED